MYLFTEWEGRTGKSMAGAHGVGTECSVGRAPLPRAKIFSCPARPKLSQYTFYHMGSLHYS